MITLSYALLGLLARQPLSGYDLSHYMKKRIAPMWSALPSQIYPELARLEKQGMLNHTVVEQQDYRPAKKVYAITEAGCEALRQWVTTPTSISSIRDEFILKAYSLWLTDPAKTIEHFREHAQIHQQHLSEHEETLARLIRECGPALTQAENPLFGSSLALHYGIAFERTYVNWCQWVIQELEQRPTPNA